MKNLIGHCAMVTGGAGGIGLSFAKELARLGCGLLLVDISAERLEAARMEICDASDKIDISKIKLLTLDLTDAEFLAILDKYCTSQCINPDILINNAGIFSFLPVKDHSEKKIEMFIDLHVRAVALLSRWFVTRRLPHGSGWLLNMSSMSCWMPMPGIALYSSTKAFIRAFTRALHYEVKDDGVKVMVACPGGIATDLFGLPSNLKKLAVAIRVLDTPERFAAKAINKMLRGKKQYINGWLNRFSIFFIAVTPTWVRMLVKRKMLDKGIVR